MQAPLDAQNCQRRRSRRTWLIVAIILLVVLIVVIVPIAVVLGRKKHHPKGLPSSVLLPLYIYPLAGAWQPLYDAINSTADLKYTIVINPDSGPGNGSIPNDDFIPNIQRLNSYPNVVTVGYVPTNYGQRDILDVQRDVATYAGWAQSGSGIEVHGIFFDEAPHEYSAEVADFMMQCNEAVQTAPGLQGNNIIIHNPGTIPDDKLRLNTTDITVVFEQSYSNYKTKQSALEDLSGSRAQYSYMVHSVPSSTDPRGLIDDMSQHAQHLFITSRDAGYYEGFGSNWGSFVQLVPTS